MTTCRGRSMYIDRIEKLKRLSAPKIKAIKSLIALARIFHQKHISTTKFLSSLRYAQFLLDQFDPVANRGHLLLLKAYSRI